MNQQKENAMNEQGKGTTQARRPKGFTILAGGTNRGFRANIDAVVAASRSQPSEVSVTTVDAEPGRAATAAALLSERGLAARPVVATVEAVIDAEPADVVVSQTDRAGTLGHVAGVADRRALPALGYLIVALRDRMLGLMIALQPADREAYASVQSLCATLERLTARGGSDRITGARAPVAFQLAEEGVRRAFSAHAEANLSRLTSGRTPNAYPVEAVWDGADEAVPVVIATREAVGNPEAVSREALAEHRAPIASGTDVLVIEVTPEILVFHEVRVRLDGLVTVEGSSALDAAAIAELRESSALSREIERRRDEASGIDTDLVRDAAVFILGQAAQAGAMSLVSSTSVTRSAPVRTTD